MLPRRVCNAVQGTAMLRKRLQCYPGDTGMLGQKCLESNSKSIIGTMHSFNEYDVIYFELLIMQIVTQTIDYCGEVLGYHSLRVAYKVVLQRRCTV